MTEKKEIDKTLKTLAITTILGIGIAGGSSKMIIDENTKNLFQNILAGYCTYFGIATTTISVVFIKDLLLYKKQLLDELKNKNEEIKLTRKEK